MKRPAAAAGLKRPAAKAEEEDTPEGAHQPLTAQAVKDHNKFCEEAAQMSSSQFEKALSCLDEKAAMRLWKAFEKSRRSTKPPPVSQWEALPRSENFCLAGCVMGRPQVNTTRQWWTRSL